ncbi:amino acid transporter [Aureobasidium pullulans]|uniref:Amino acid transporter n=1 Tax=Aureobasidium pullulans TaxID=5580 RepID=A0A4V4LEG7_AURPU|nr:amino acid transporter [Aureobasidium pullulans]
MSSIELDLRKGMYPIDVEARESSSGVDHQIAQPRMERRFHRWQMVGFSCTIMITWEGLLFVFTYGLENGGPAGLVYGYLFCWIGYLAVVLSLAELVSMMPNAAGQYFWVGTLAPPQYRKFLSWMTGWQQFLAWQADIASAAYLASEVLLGLVNLNIPSYVPKGWQVTLVLYAIMLFALAFNTVLIRFLPHVEWIILVIHIVGFIVIAVPVTYFAKHNTASEVFTTLLTLGDYSAGTSFFVGLMTSVFAFLGADGAIHMCEEVDKPEVEVPKSLVHSITINGFLGFGMMLIMLFCIGDVQDALNSPTGFPFIQIFQQALPNSIAFTTGLASLLLVLLVSAVVAVTAAASRVTWAFARDDGLPGSSYLKKIDDRAKLPIWSITLSFVVTLLLGLINVGSATAFNAVISLMVASYLASYLPPIALLAWKRWTKQGLQMGRWHLGRFGLATNIAAIVWTTIVFLFSFWPTTSSVTLQTMNWAVLLWGGSFVLGCLLYIRQRNWFRTPAIA